MGTFLALDQTLTPPDPTEEDTPAPPYCPPLSLYPMIKEEIADDAPWPWHGQSPGAGAPPPPALSTCSSYAPWVTGFVKTQGKAGGVTQEAPAQWSSSNLPQ